jgi:glycosyltransferase involved in cell wall biosynthesis
MQSQSDEPAVPAGSRLDPPELAGIVLALGGAASAVDAVRSLLEQDPPVEVVVVNSGGGDMRARLREAGLDVPVVEREERLFAGAVRNLGIAATRAPYVGFLAADCKAAPGWSLHRLHAHRAGKAVVASAVIPSHPRNPFAWASHLALFRRRLPGIGAKSAALYGASYDRSLFEEYGLFRGDLRVAEDTEFHARLADHHKPVWTPKVRAIHTSPTGPISLLRDQYGRGYRASDASWNVSRKRVPFGPRWTYMQVRSAVRMSRRIANRRDRRTIRIAWLLLPFAIGAYALGGAMANRRRQSSSDV